MTYTNMLILPSKILVLFKSFASVPYGETSLEKTK